jgi:hypothetical protein
MQCHPERTTDSATNRPGNEIMINTLSQPVLKSPQGRGFLLRHPGGEPTWAATGHGPRRSREDLDHLRPVDVSSAGASLLAFSVERGVRPCDKVFGRVVWLQFGKANRYRPVVGDCCQCCVYLGEPLPRIGHAQT